MYLKGTLGLFLGVSVMSFFEIIEIILELSYIFIYNKVKRVKNTKKITVLSNSAVSIEKT